MVYIDGLKERFQNMVKYTVHTRNIDIQLLEISGVRQDTEKVRT